MDTAIQTTRKHPLVAKSFFKTMRGGAKSVLLLANDGRLYVTKFLGNPQNSKVLFNELLTSRIAEALELTVPNAQTIHVDEDLCKQLPHTSGLKSPAYSPGLHFASQFAGGLMPGLVSDYVSGKQCHTIRNIEEVAGATVMDVWLGNDDYRQCVYVRQNLESDFQKIYWIDHGHCLGYDSWNFKNWRFRPACKPSPYLSTWRNLEPFEPWLDRIENFSIDHVKPWLKDVPQEWLQGTSDSELDRFLDQLSARRRLLRGLLQDGLRRWPTIYPGFTLQ